MIPFGETNTNQDANRKLFFVIFLIVSLAYYFSSFRANNYTEQSTKSTIGEVQIELIQTGNEDIMRIHLFKKDNEGDNKMDLYKLANKKDKRGLDK